MNMESKIEKLLHKYWETESSVEEEKELKALLKNEDSSENAEIKILFDHFESENAKELGADFDSELLGLIEEKEEVKVLKFSDYVKRYSSIAAAVLVLFISSYVFIQQQRTFETEDSFDTPEAAYAELKKQLLMVSHYMNKGSETVGELSNLGKVDNALEGIGMMEKASQATMGHLSELNISN